MGMDIKAIRIDGCVAYIRLTHGYEAIIDAVDIHIVDKWNWRAEVRKYTVYASRSAGRKVIRMHREIMGFPNSHVDHIDTNGLNNKRQNLRLATHAQNLCNRVAPSSNTSGHKGVYWSKENKKYAAAITVMGRKKHLGLFLTKEEAVKAYNAGSMKYHGEFGRFTC